MDQKCPFLGSKEIGSKFLENKTKKAQNKQKTNNNKTNQKTPTENNLQCTLDIHSVTSHSARGCLEDVPSSFLSPDLSCFIFLEGGLPIIYSPSESNCTYRPFFTLPAIRQGVTTQEIFGRRDTTFGCCVGGAGAASLDSLFRNRPVQSKGKSKDFILLIWETLSCFNQLHAS